MNALQQPPASLVALRQRKSDLELSLAQHQDLLDRLHALLTARKQGNERMDVPVDIGMGFTAEGVVNDTSHILVSAGVQELFLDLPVEAAQAFVQKKEDLLQKRLDGLEKQLARAEAEHQRVLETLKAAFEVQDSRTSA